MNQTVHLLGLSFVVLLTLPTLALDEILRGEWISRDRATVVRMEACTGKLSVMCATVVADQPEAGDPSLVGHVIGSDFAYQSGGVWSGYVVTVNGTKLNAKISMPHANQIDIEVCAALVFCDRSTYFRQR